MGYTNEKLQKIWEKGRPIPNNSPDVYRYDVCNAPMMWSEYGKQTKYGWTVDHITPVSRGGTDELSNLRPLQWENNAKRQEGTLQC